MPARKSQLPPDEWLKEFARDILQKNTRPEMARAQTSVTLRRRFRGTGKSDRFGLFDAISGVWLGDDPAQQMMMDLYSLNIVKPIITANQAAMVQARVECTVDPTSKKNEGVAAVSLGVYKVFNNHPDYWSNNLENQTNQQVQTDYGVWLHTHFDPDAESPINTKVNEYSDMPLEDPGEYACKCGAGGDLFSEMLGQATDDGQFPCPSCGQMAEILAMPTEGAGGFAMSKAEYPSGNTVMDVVSMYQIRIDERPTKSGNTRKARWLEHHYPIDEEDLQAMVPEFDLQGATEWSYPLKWEYCLESGNDMYLRPWSSDMTDKYGKKPYEIRKIYVRPSAYRHYRSPTDFTLDRGDGRAAVNPDGSVMLDLKAGEGFIDQYPKGFYFLINGEQILPYIKGADLRDEWSYFGFINDASSTYHQPVAELNELQRATNNLYTIDVQQRESASINTRVYDSEYFTADDLEQQLAPTSRHIEKGDDIRRHAATLEGVPSSAPMEGMNFIRSIVGDVSGVQPAMIGRPQPGVAYAAQAQQREQSLGRLIPSQFSKAEAKACSLLQFLKHAQRHWPRERFDHIAMMYGEKWRDRDIDDFLNANLDLAIQVDYKEDSVVPASLIQQQLAFQQVITLVANAAKATGDKRLLSLQIIQKYIHKMLPGEDIDIENVDTDERLADSRYRKIKARLAEELEANLPIPQAVAQALNHEDLMPLPREVADTHIEFYMDEARALLAADNPNYPLLNCVLEMIKRHERADVQGGQQQVADDLEKQAPVAAVQKAAAEMQGQGAAQAEQAKAQGAAQQKAMELQQKAQAGAQAEQMKTQRELLLERQRQHFDLEKQEREMMDREDAREHDAQKAEADYALRAADLAQNAGTREPNIEGISTAFKDLPKGAKEDVLDERGLSTEGIKDTQVNKPTVPPKAKSAERRPLA